MVFFLFFVRECVCKANANPGAAADDAVKRNLFREKRPFSNYLEGKEAMSRAPEDPPFSLPENFARADGGAMRPVLDRDCLHGGPPPRASSTLAVKLPLIGNCVDQYSAIYRKMLERHANDDTKLEELQNERAVRELSFLEEYWSPPERSCHIDESMSKLCFSLATDATLDENFVQARIFLQVGLFVRQWARVGEAAFRQALRSKSIDNEYLKGWLSSLTKTSTDRGMTLFLSRHIPCSCLDAVAQQAAARPPMAKCWYCNREDEKLRIQKCGGCKRAEYCSKDCQACVVNPWFCYAESCVLILKTFPARCR